jgi:uncharacterized protein (DUF885 family)
MRVALSALVLLELAPALALGGEPTTDLRALLAEAWQFALREDPLFATTTGDARYNGRLPSISASDFGRRGAFWKATLGRLHGIDQARLAEGDQVSYAMFERKAGDEIAELGFRTWRMPLNAEGGFHSDFARLPAAAPFETTKDYEDYLSRLEAFPAFARQQEENMREGLRTGFTQPRAILEGLEKTIAPHVVKDVAESVFWTPLARLPKSVPEAEAERLRAKGRAAILEHVVPAYARLLQFITKEYIPGARQTVGAADLPDGKAYYAWRVRHFTTEDVSPEDVHALGLREVARIRAEMDGVLKQVKWEKGFAAFLEFLRTDSRFYARTPEELLREAAFIAKRMDGKLPSLFKTLPRQPYGVEPVPADIAPRYTGGRYDGAPIDGRRAGMYWVNTYALETRPLYTLEALTLHEAVPGHHLQTSLQQELRDVPSFRRFEYVDAFGEGWGLYSEWLGLEAGFYQDPYRNFGRLTYEMWRACRLVVDTGLHAKGWTRDQALRFLAENTALSLHEVATETDRYIGWPGQALAYKMGELKIRALRRRAEDALGPRFDVRDFHDAVLKNGSVPLSVLETQVDAYIAATKARP